MVRWLVTLGFAALASVVAWFVTGRALDERARQAAASAWVDAELCLVGPALASGARPSTRMRTIALGPDAGRGWPKRCADVSRLLDEALKAPPLSAAFATAPRLVVSLAASSTERDATVDRLWTMLRDAGLPAGTPSWKGVSPEPTVVALKRAGMEVLATGFSLDAITFDWSSADGALRFLLPGDEPRWCRVDLESSTPELRCLALGENLPNPPRMPWSEAKAPEFLFGRVAGRLGFFDAAAGTRIWSPPTEEAFAVVRMSGEATVLQTEPHENEEKGDSWRLVRLVPGQPQESRLLELPVGSRALLFPAGIVWWQPNRSYTPLYFAALERDRLTRRSTIGSFEPPTKILTRCALGQAHALVLEGAKKRKLLIGAGKRFRLDDFPSDGELSCFGGQIRSVRLGSARIEVRRCDGHECRNETSVPPSAENVVVVPVGDALVSLVVDSGGIGRAYVSTSKEARANPKVVFEDAAAGGLDARAMRAVGGQKRGILFLQDEERRIYALAFDANGDPTALATRSW